MIIKCLKYVRSLKKVHILARRLENYMFAEFLRIITNHLPPYTKCEIFFFNVTVLFPQI